MNGWYECKNLLIIRADNMGDLIMSSPAIRALKLAFKCRITVLASASSSEASRLIPEIDEVIIAELPWVKKDSVMQPAELIDLAERLRNYRFDGCVIFTVYSQNPLPAAMLAWMADIPRRLAYCRENPYTLLNYWVPDKEPYTFIRHQVKRDMALIESIGVITENDRIVLSCPSWAFEHLDRKLEDMGIDLSAPFMIFHPGVSEEKRAFPSESWQLLVAEARKQFGMSICITGSSQETGMVDKLTGQDMGSIHALAGKLTIPELAALISRATIVVSVNTGPVHMAAGLQTPVIVLYAMTNPQHTPWKVQNQVFEFSVPENLQSKNEVIRYVNDLIYNKEQPYPQVSDILAAMGAFIRHTVGLS